MCLSSGAALGCEKLHNLFTGGGAEPSTENGAFYGGRSIGEGNRVRDTATLRDRKSEGAMEYIAGSQGIDSSHLRRTQLLELPLFNPKAALRTVGDGNKAIE